MVIKSQQRCRGFLLENHQTLLLVPNTSSKGGFVMAKKMSPACYYTLLVALWLLVIYLNYAESREASTTFCQHPCQTIFPPPPPPSGYPLYGAPPPPLPIPEYPLYVPPPPAPQLPGILSPPSQANCPQVPPHCCQNPPPYPYGYQPEVSHSASRSPFYFIPFMLLLFSIDVLL